MNEELNKNLDILELEKIKEILPEYIHQTSKEKLNFFSCKIKFLLLSTNIQLKDVSKVVRFFIE